MSNHTATRSGPPATPLLERWALPLVLAATIAAFAAIIVLTGGDDGPTAASTAPGSEAPDFSALDVVSGEDLSLADLEGQQTLLFFSEGAACQACMVQIIDLEKSRALEKRGIALVNITTDPPDLLREAVDAYGITTPTLSDASQEMSIAYDMLGRGGMEHPDQDGHAFTLVDSSGNIAWEGEYRSMYVPPADLLAELPRAGA